MTDRETIEMLIGLKQMGPEDVGKMQTMYRKYIDSKAVVCSTCSSQVIFTHKRLTDWYNRAVRNNTIDNLLA